MNITGSREGIVFFIDDDKVMIGGKMYYEEKPSNLPQANVKPLLCDVNETTEKYPAWISVKDRLPEENTFALISCKSGHVTVSFFRSTGHDYNRKMNLAPDKDSEKWKAGWESGHEVTHWMPLPICYIPKI